MENKKKHILIVDDDNRIRDLLKEYLNENNYIVSTSENAEMQKLNLINLNLINCFRRNDAWSKWI